MLQARVSVDGFVFPPSSLSRPSLLSSPEPARLPYAVNASFAREYWADAGVGDHRKRARNKKPFFRRSLALPGSLHPHRRARGKPRENHTRDRVAVRHG